MHLAATGQSATASQWVAEDFQSSYVALLRRLLEADVYTNSPRGMASREITGVSVLVRDPRRRWVLAPWRRTNLAFNFAEALWYLAGSNDLDHIAYYAPSIRRYSADGRTLAGTAYGPRIFAHGEEAIDQWQRCRELIQQDRDTKRALIQIFEPRELQDSANPDVACTVAMHLMWREGRLHAAVFMRANDAYRGAASDVFSFTFLQEVFARDVGAELGPYFHCVSSYHLYEEDLPRVSTDECSPPPPMPAMPDGDPWPSLRALLALERECRISAHALTPGGLDAFGLTPFWRHVGALLAAYGAYRRGRAAACRALLEVTEPLYRESFLNRFPGALGCRP